MPKNTVFCKSAENWRGHRLYFCGANHSLLQKQIKSSFVMLPFPQEGKENDSITQIKRL